MSIYDDIETFGMTGDDYVAPIADHDAIAQMANAAVAAVMEALEASGLAHAAGAIGWGVVNAVHREIDRLERKSDANAAEIRDLSAAQDGSEVRDVELQDAMLAQARMAELRDALSTFREAAAEAYATATGQPWLPRSGSRTGHGVTAAQIDARAMLKARREQRLAELNPEGPKFVVTGHVDWDDVTAVFDALDKLKARRPDLVIVTRNARGAELIARKWAAQRDVAQITVTPNWSLGKQAAFKAIDAALELKPEGVVTFESAARPANGITLNLIQKAAAKRIAVWRVGRTPAAAASAA